MNNQLAKSGRKFAFKQIGFTFGVIIFFVLVTYFLWGYSSAKSAFVGGLVVIIPNSVFAYKAFKYAGAKSSEKVMESFYSGVKIKMGLMALLFALAFKFLVLLPIPFFAMFCAVMAIPLLTPFIFKHKL